MKKTVVVPVVIVAAVAVVIGAASLARNLMPAKTGECCAAADSAVLQEISEDCVAPVVAGAASNTGWLRKAAISPDGKTIAFSYQGDIFTVPVSGGAARQITTNTAYESDPMWTPDGKAIVFTSAREDSRDIWKISPLGGTPVRITRYQGGESPLCVTPDGKVIFLAAIQADAKSSVFPGDPQVWSVSLSGGKPEMLFPFAVGNVSVNKKGDILYEDYKGYEDPLRKHHTSSVTRDVWVRKAADGKFAKLSDFVGEDRNPVFAADGDTFYYVSERENSVFNVYRSSLSKPEENVKITSFETHPVRNISVAADGTVLLSWNGSLYTVAEGAQPSKLAITVTKDTNDKDVVIRALLGGITNFSPSASGAEIAIVAHGDVFVSAAEFRATRRITNTPSQERKVSMAPDGKSIYFDAERNGHWGIWKVSLKNKDDKFFSVGGELVEEQFSEGDQTCFQPAVSPDGKWVAFLRNRTEVVIRSTDGKEEKSLFKDANYSYQDGDQSFAWSPDSKHILVEDMRRGGWNNVDIAVVDIADGKIVNLTQSGYNDGGFRWALGGKAMTWESDRFGYRSHGSWGSEGDILVMFFDGAAYADFNRDENIGKIEKALVKKSDKKSEKKDEKADKAPEIVLDLEHIEDRTVRLTNMSGHIGDHILSPDGTTLYYTALTTTGSYQLHSRDLKKGEVKVVKSGVRGGFVPSADGKFIYVSGLFGISKIALAGGASTSISFDGEFEYRAREEREYMFEHAWKQVDEKFYDKDIHGVDWKGMHDNYAQFLPYINNNEDFKDMLSEMLGELNGSHTGARYRTRAGRNVAHFGVFFDENYSGKGLRIAEVLPGSNLQNIYPEIKAGDVITAVDGVEIGENAVWYDVLDRKAGKRVALTIKVAKDNKLAQAVTDALGLEDEVEVRMVAGISDAAALYERWVRRNEQIVEKLSGGRIGYVHVEGMNSPSFRNVYSKALGKYRDCDALIVDTRHNGGGWLHDDLATFLNGKAYVEFRPRGQYIGTEPFSKWTKPSCVLVCEDNYSDASGFPYVYRTLGIGKLIGTPVPGTMTAVWWETQIDNSIVFGIPQVTSWGLAEDRPLENLQLEPDVLVYNDPQSVIDGVDKQLETAVAEMLKEVKK